MALLGMSGVTMAYVMRVCLSITLTQMVKPVTAVIENGAVHNDYCPMPEMSRGHLSNRTSGAGAVTDYSDRFDWDEETQGKILSAFYYGYILTHLPGGVLSQKFGGKHAMGLGILSTALFTLMTPSVARMGATPLTILRFIEGLGEVSERAMNPVSFGLSVADRAVFATRRTKRVPRVPDFKGAPNFGEKNSNLPFK